ncbi:MAG: caspase family protein [Saprospiraceae bacterium]|nr:caspase family protein [Saprospiraceae bacterium]
MYRLNIHIILLYCVYVFAFIGSSFSQQIGCTIGDCENGKGRFVFDNGDKYIGEFKNSLPHGRGAYYNKEGSTYKGPFIEGRRQGYGTFTWTNGDKYIGEYYNNMRHGEGIYLFANGIQQKGIWRDGIFIKEFIEEEELRYGDRVTNVLLPNSAKDSSDKNLQLEKNIRMYFKAIKSFDTSQARTALIIGNSNYNNSPLRNPVNDALAMAIELKNSGFNVMVYINIDQKTMKKAIREFGEKLKEIGGVGLFFYGGHGLQADGRNFLVPIDATIKKVQDIEFESVDLGRVLSEFEYAENDMNIIILDACRDNPYKEAFEKSKHMSYNGLASIGSAPYNSYIAFATGPGSVALDGKGKNSLYTQELLKAMKEPGKGIEEVFKKVRKNVRRFSEGKQIPWESSSVEDDFYFKKK